MAAGKASSRGGKKRAIAKKMANGETTKAAVVPQLQAAWFPGLEDLAHASMSLDMDSWSE
eukprot:4299830-Amphidinium_carterae.1